jgi:uncharacterized protein (DUF433 family)
LSNEKTSDDKKWLVMIEYRNYIKINPNKRFGKPCVRDTRISVYDVLSWLSLGMDFNEIIDDFPELTKEDIRACLAYAADKEHRLLHAS